MSFGSHGFGTQQFAQGKAPTIVLEPYQNLWIESCSADSGFSNQDISSTVWDDQTKQSTAWTDKTPWTSVKKDCNN